MLLATRIKWISGISDQEKLEQKLDNITNGLGMRPRKLRKRLNIIGQAKWSHPDAVRSFISFYLGHVNEEVRDSALNALRNTGADEEYLKRAIAHGQQSLRGLDNDAATLERYEIQMRTTGVPQTRFEMYNMISNHLNGLGDPRGAHLFGHSKERGYYKYRR